MHKQVLPTHPFRLQHVLDPAVIRLRTFARPELHTHTHHPRNPKYWKFEPPAFYYCHYPPQEVSETCAEVEERISQREKISQTKIAIQKLRSPHPPASNVRGVHGKRLAPDQGKTLHDYFIQLDKTGMPARLYMIEEADNPLRVVLGPSSRGSLSDLNTVIVTAT